ncbi:hypothetical protein ASPZODRAFT_72662 [Penicilliopsis zonata CBS 506.65]|uniref:Uncharacterized protein n=1 Tax=Penicilliopsis zonata CBS 506.65 TaxID=1073090 RepID=A0A1L9S9U2_9EURO|nr:hypothetical protein ASPZODRAFT_72662 [Penicilliopsis zonata CBS 506.65]OJJ43945.1 hypothetical protein ASPZODRAFT_72662 [Penicilliopsis zonata CBS 506.65]
MANKASSAGPSALAQSLSAHSFESQLSEQLQHRKEQGDPNLPVDELNNDGSHLVTPQRGTPKSRSLSDAVKPVSIPQPVSGDLKTASKDDSSIPSIPATPQRSTVSPSNLSLNLPLKIPAAASASSRAPLSPKLDSSQIYGSPASVLPRRSRGLDFSRACTNLHHSTLAESSPDSSPTIGGRGVNIPNRRGSLNSTSVPPFSTSGPADRTAISSSVSSVNMLESDTSSSDEDDEQMGGDRDEMMITNTPQANKMGAALNPFGVGTVSSPGGDWMGSYSQAAASLLSFQRARFRNKGRSRHSSSSASANSSKQSPGPLSPPVMKSIENPAAGGYFACKNALQSRRESLSLGTRDLRLSDLSDDGESRAIRGHSPAGMSNPEGGPLGVIRRAVTRRSSLLPKTKTFARIRAALVEESAPIDSEAKREAQVIRQVRESDTAVPQKSPTLESFSSFSPPRPSQPALEQSALPKSEVPGTSGSPFGHQAMRNSSAADFWNSIDGRYRTPPPPLRSNGPASVVSEDDTAMDITPSTSSGFNMQDLPKPWDRPPSRSSTSHASNPISINDIQRKRRRDDDFDPNLFKRRAVSPSMSAQSSPILMHSPTVKDVGPNIWGPPSKPALGPPLFDRLGHENANRPTAPAGTVKRVGLQGMTEASDGFMNMSIE